MRQRGPSRTEMTALLDRTPARRGPLSALVDVYRRDATVRFLSEFAGLSLLVLVAAGSLQVGGLRPVQLWPGPGLPEAGAQAPVAATPTDPREAGLSLATGAVGTNITAGPTPSLYRLNAGAVSDATLAIRARLAGAIDAYRRHEPAASILTSIEDLDPGQRDTAFVRGLATIALGGPHNAAAGIADLKRAAEALYGLALLNPPALLERDTTEGRRWLQKAADAGDHGAQYLLGYAYLSGWAGLIDPVKGASLLKAAADGGEVEAMKLLAGLYLTGRGVPKDVDACEHYLRRAVESGDLDAQGFFGTYLVASSLSGWGQSLDEGVRWLRTAAEAGNPKAMHMLGMVQVEFAKAPPLRDIKAGVDWFERCADLGKSECQFALGHAYAEGLGRPKNLVLAARSFVAAARSGSPRGWTELARVNAELSSMGLSEEPGSPSDPGPRSAMPAGSRSPTFSDTVRQGGSN